LRTPWSKNEDLIKLLHSQLEETKSHIKTLETKDTLAEALRSLESKISENVYAQISNEDFLTKIVLHVVRELKKKDVGIC
jgi:hypothetical protein